MHFRTNTHVCLAISFLVLLPLSASAAGVDVLEVVAEYPFGDGRVVYDAMSPDGKYLARCKEKTSVEIIEAVSGKPVHTLTAAGQLHWLEYSGNAKVLAAYTSDGVDQSRDLRTTFYDTSSWKRTGEVKHDRHYDRRGVALSPNGRLLAHATAVDIRTMSATLRVFDGRKQKELTSFDGLRVYETHVMFAGDNKLLAVNNDPPELIDLAKKSRTKLPKPPRGVLSLAINRKATFAAYGGITSELAVADIAAGKLRWQGSMAVQSVSAITFAKDDKYVIASTADSGIRIYSADDGKLVAAKDGPSTGGANTLQVSEDGTILVSHLPLTTRTVVWKLNLE